MMQSTWNPEIERTWQALAAFQLDDPDAVFTFTDRLSKENGWTRKHATRAIQEYKRFLLLARHAGHPVTPSETVDQVWHLHLVFTRSYWRDLCANVLGSPLHHDPTKGDLGESARFRSQYEQTLRSYFRFFGEEAPRDIWPEVEGVSRTKLPRWIDLSLLQLIRRPDGLRRLRPRMILPAMAAAAFGFAAVGCGQWNVFDRQGSDFLKVYLIAISLAWLVSVLLIAFIRRRLCQEELPLLPSDPYAIAFLGGGGRRMVDAAFTALFTRGLLAVEIPKSGKALIGRSDSATGIELHPMEKLAQKALPENGKAEVGAVRASLAPLTNAMRDSMTEVGLVYSSAHISRQRWVASLPILLVIGGGTAQLMFGWERGNSNGYLAFLLFFSSIFLFWRLATLKKRTRTGDILWNELRSQKTNHPAIVRNGERFIDPNLAALMVAVGGLGTLDAGPFRPLHDTLHRRGADSGGGCGTGDCGDGGCGGGGGGCGGE